MVWHGDDPSKREAILDPKGVVSVYGGRQIPTGRKRRAVKGYAGYGDLDPPNTRLYQLLHGDLEVSELSNDELQAGTTVCNDGKFSIRAAYESATMPRRIKAAIQRELVSRANDMITGSALDVLGRMIEIATSPSSDDKDALKAQQYLLDRGLGKTPDRVIHTEEKKFEVLIDGIERGSRSASRQRRELERQAPLEAEIVEEL